MRRSKPLVPRETALALALRDARAHVRKPMAEVGAAIGASTRTIARWESGRTVPPVRLRARLRDALAPLPPALSQRLHDVLGLALPPPPPPLDSYAPFVEECVRRAADHADLRASELRTALGRLLLELGGAQVPLDALAVALLTAQADERGRGA